MKPGDFVKMDGWSEHLMAGAISLANAPRPVWDGSAACTWSLGEVGFVLDTYVEEDPEMLTLSVAYCKVLVPRGVGWVDSQHVEAAH